MEFKIEVTKNMTNEVIATLEERTYDALKLMGLQAERNAKLNLEHDPRRVDTGLLRNSITHAIGGEEPATTTYKSNSTHGHTDSTERRGIAGTPVTKPKTGTYNGVTPKKDVPCCYVGTNVEYAPEVHYGTDRMAPNYFLRDAVYGHEQEYIDLANHVFHYGTS